ncbi:unnamed protein product [Penicillium olsonii]|nr:unnamed protein product [Penicillium olsonii]CAG7929811.1 unnamed protein product [Penicillium olsonii]
MSQPSKRLSLKVLKAKNENNNWSYAPSADASLQDAALKVVGAETASSCVLKRLSSQSADAADVASSPDQIRCEVVAFLPDIQPETPKINNMGQYISVDGRPLSNSRGIGQEITKNFKTYIRSAISKSESPKQMTDPFLGLQILCSRGIYDVNIEPAKDDVMFEDRDLVLALVTRLFREQYGETESEETTGTKQRKENSPKRPRIPSGFDVLMARKPVPESHTGPLFSDDHSSASTTNARLSQQKTPIKDITGPTKNVGSESNGSVEKTAKRLGSFNPESISRINASFQTPLRGSVSQISPRSRNQPSYNTRRPEGGHNDQEGVQCSPTNSDLPSPPISRIHLGSPVRSRRPQPQASPESSPEIDRMSSFRRADRERDRERYGNGALDTWFLRTTQVSLEEPLTEEAAPLQEPTELPLSSLAEKRFGSKPSGDGRNGDEQHGACLEGSSQDASPLLAHNTISPPDQQDDQDHTSMDSGRGFPVLERWAAQLHQDGAQAEPTDLEKALDFEKRKREAIQSRRLKQKSGGTVPSSQQEPIPQSSQNSRYLAAKAALTSTGAPIGEPFSATKLAPNDPRAYLIRNQDISVGRDTSEAEGKGRRLLTSRLPFERIPDGLALYNMGIKCSVDQSLGPDAVNLCAREDEYTRTGDQAIAFSPAAVKDCLPLWNARLQQIVKDQYESKDDLQLSRDKVDISSAITQHLNAFDTEQV